MRCPGCDQQTITFGDWSRARNAFRWQCPHCGSLLKANRTTWRWFASALVMLVPMLFGVLALAERGIIAHGSEKLFLLAGIVVLIGPLSYLAYRRGGYDKR